MLLLPAKTEKMKQHRILMLFLLLVILFVPCSSMGNNKSKQLLINGQRDLERSDYNVALKKFLDYIKIEEKKVDKDTVGLINTYCNIGGIYSVYQNFAQALDMYDKAYQLCQKSNNKTMEFQVINNMIGANCNIGKLEKAELLNQKVLKLDGINKGEKMFYYNFNRGFIASSKKQVDEKIKWMNLAVRNVDQYHLPQNMKAYPYSEIYQCYEQRGQLDKALCILLKYDTLAHYINKTSNRHNRGQAYLIADCYKGLMRIYTKLGNKEKALFYQNAYFKYNDSLLNVNEFSTIRNQYQTYENNQTQNTINDQQKTIYYQKVILGMLIVLIITATVAIIIIRRQQKTLYDTNVALFDRNNDLVEAESKATHENINTPKIEEKTENDTEHEELLDKIKAVMCDENVFCNPEFSLGMLARLTQSNTNYVSQAINTRYNKNFRTFVNEYRIKVAMKRMKNNDKYSNYSIQGISESVGYKSASNFIAAFKKMTGMTPSLYQKLSRKE